MQAQDDELIFDTPLEEEIEDLEVSPNNRQIITKQSDPEIDSLYNQYQSGRLIIQPDFQRQFVWDKKKSSRLIESALLGIPLPVIYMSEESTTSVNVIDGQQRLTSFFPLLKVYSLMEVLLSYLD
jgi:uncharacterized protein with ParB-like and HNH nuclease domain